MEINKNLWDYLTPDAKKLMQYFVDNKVDFDLALEVLILLYPDREIFFIDEEDGPNESTLFN